MGGTMGRSIAYWVSTGIVAAMMIFSGVLYLSGSAQAVTGFAHVGYPQHLRIILQIGSIAYWVSTGIVAAMMIFSGVLYLSGSAQAVTGFAHVGYPQHLRIIL